MVCHMQIIMVCTCSVLERLEEKGNPFLWPAQQLEMPHLITHPLPLFRERKRPRSIPVSPKSAIERHQPVADEALGDTTTTLAERRGQRDSERLAAREWNSHAVTPT